MGTYREVRERESKEAAGAPRRPGRRARERERERERKKERARGRESERERARERENERNPETYTGRLHHHYIHNGTKPQPKP